MNNIFMKKNKIATVALFIVLTVANCAFVVSAESYDYILEWGTYGSEPSQFNYPEDIAVDSSGNVYVTDFYNSRVQKFSPNGEFITQWGNDGSEGQLSYPVGLTVDSEDNVYVTDVVQNCVFKYTNNGVFLTAVIDSALTNAMDVAVDGEGNFFVIDINYVKKFNDAGAVIAYWGGYGSGIGQFNHAERIVVDSENNVYVTDQFNSRVQKFSPNGEFITQWGNDGSEGQLSHPLGLAVDSENNIYVTDDLQDCVLKFTSEGLFISQWGSQGTQPGQFSYPSGIAVDNSGHVFVLDKVLFSVQKFSCDTLPPVIELISPLENGVYPIDSGLKYDFVVTDNLDSEVTVISTIRNNFGEVTEIENGDNLPTTSGVYTLTITATDDAGLSSTLTSMFTVYDPDGGFVTGGGWIISKAGAYTLEPELEGKASFGFVSKYKKGATLPDGNTEFIFHAGDMKFSSISYDWLVIAGSKAIFKGEGTVNEQGCYKFMLTANDGGNLCDDTFRIKIWQTIGDVDVPIYDNMGDIELGGGNIIVHK